MQSALLEAMEERQVTLGDTTYPLDDPFLVLATQNPIEQEGTYPLPEAQVDRFMLKLKLDYPTRAEEEAILERMMVERRGRMCAPSSTEPSSPNCGSSPSPSTSTRRCGTTSSTSWAPPAIRAPPAAPTSPI